MQRCSGNCDWQVAQIENQDGDPVSVAPGSGHTVWLALPADSVGAFVAHYLRGAPESAVRSGAESL